jgi:hypothetical protein
MILLCCVCRCKPSRIHEVVARRIPMAKGQVRGNKEVKKPKKPKQVVAPVGSFITPPKADKPTKGQH